MSGNGHITSPVDCSNPAPPGKPRIIPAGMVLGFLIEPVLLSADFWVAIKNFFTYLNVSQGYVST